MASKKVRKGKGIQKPRKQRKRSVPIFEISSTHSSQQTTQHPQECPVSLSTDVFPLLRRLWCLTSLGLDPWLGTPSRINILARVAVSKTSSTPSIRKAEHSLYARAPITCATRSPCSRVTHGQGLSAVLGWLLAGRRSALQPTRMTGMVGPHIERTSSIHCDGV